MIVDFDILAIQPTRYTKKTGERRNEGKEEEGKREGKKSRRETRKKEKKEAETLLSLSFPNGELKRSPEGEARSLICVIGGRDLIRLEKRHSEAREK